MSLLINPSSIAREHTDLLSNITRFIILSFSITENVLFLFVFKTS